MISAAHANVSKQIATKIEETSMKGLRRPHLSFEESDIVPITGWTMRPDSGGAIQTREVSDFAKPNLRR
jgi:hypothetical protein